MLRLVQLQHVLCENVVLERKLRSDNSEAMEWGEQGMGIRVETRGDGRKWRRWRRGRVSGGLCPADLLIDQSPQWLRRQSIRTRLGAHWQHWHHDTIVTSTSSSGSGNSGGVGGRPRSSGHSRGTLMLDDHKTVVNSCLFGLSTHKLWLGQWTWPSHGIIQLIPRCNQ